MSRHNTRKLPPYCFTTGSKIKLRRLAKQSTKWITVPDDGSRVPDFQWETPDDSADSFSLAWMAFSLICDVEQYGNYTKINTNHYDPNTYDHLSVEFINEFATGQTHTAIDKKSLHSTLRAVRKTHLTNTRSCVDKANLIRDLNADMFLKARLAAIKKAICNVNDLISQRTQIFEALYPNAAGHFSVDTIPDVANAGMKIDSLLGQSKRRRIFIGNRPLKVCNVIQISKCGANYRVPCMSEQNKLMAVRDIPVNTIIGVYPSTMMPESDWGQLHLHPEIGNAHGAYTMKLTMHSLDEEKLRDVMVRMCCIIYEGDA